MNAYQAYEYVKDKIPFFGNRVRSSNSQDAVKIAGELSWNDNDNETVISNKDDYFPIALPEDAQIHSQNFLNFGTPVTLEQSGWFTIDFIAWLAANSTHNITGQIYADDTPKSIEFPISGAPPAFGYSKISGVCHRMIEAGKTLRLKVRNHTAASNVTVVKLVAIARKQ